MRIIKTSNYEKVAGKEERGRRDETGPFEGSYQVKKNQSCKECGNLAVGEDGLCSKCWEEEEHKRQRYSS